MADIRMNVSNAPKLDELMGILDPNGYGITKVKVVGYAMDVYYLLITRLAKGGRLLLEDANGKVVEIEIPELPKK